MNNSRVFRLRRAPEEKHDKDQFGKIRMRVRRFSQ